MGFKFKKLGDVCHFVRGPFGGSLKKSCFVSEGHAVYEQQHAIYDQFTKIRYFVDDNKFEEMQRFELKPGDLIMSCSGTMGKVSIVPQGIKKGIINQALLKLTPSNELDVEYLKYWMVSNDFQESLAKFTVGAAIKNVASVKILKQIEIPCPDVETQKQIVALLDQAFKAIDQAQQNIEKNIANAKELFQSKLNAIFSQTGEGWEERTLHDLISIRHGYAFKSKDFTTNYEGTNPIVLTPGNFSEDAKLYFTIKNTKRCISDFPVDYKFEEGELVVVMTDLSSKMKILGKPAVINSNNILHNQRIGRVIFKSDDIERDILYYYFQSKPYLEEIKNTATGTMVRHTAPKRILENTISFPTSKEQQQKTIALLKDLRAFIENLENKYRKKLINLEELKKSILQKAFNGELT